MLPPPINTEKSKNFLKSLPKKLIATAVFCALASTSVYADPGDVIDNQYLKDHYQQGWGDGQVEYSKSEDFAGIHVGTDDPLDTDNLYQPVSQNDQILMKVWNRATININGDTYIRSHSFKTNFNSLWIGVYLINASSGVVNLNGNIDIVMTKEPGVWATTGFNAIYAINEGSEINLGTEGSTTRIWVIADKPDAISAKKGADVHFKSTNNQIVGSFDMYDNDGGTNLPTSTIDGTFSGQTAYWFGDDTSYDNLTSSNKDRTGTHGVIDLVFENGAQWSYLDEASSAIKHRISNITLRNGGIINLFDDNLHEFWDSIGLLDKMGSYRVKHDYVTIGDLKGSGGIFRLDLDAEDRTQSDMIYIEGSSDPGQHLFEPYNLDRLESITPENILVFALTKGSGTEVTFADKVNLEGEYLHDYELEISSDQITEEDLNREEISSKNEDASSYVDGEKWFIRRIRMSQSSAALAMTGAGFAAYDAANEMDRRDRRLLQTFKDETTGLWVRARHGERGVDNQYNYQLDGAAVGIDRALSDTATLGLSFSYEQGDTDFESVRGNGDMKRYELAVYNTYDYGAPYIDLVGRLGMVSSDYETYNRSGTLKTTGDFDQKYAALSAEVGYTLKDTNGVFIEPQLQVQVTYLDGYDYSSDRQMEVDVDSDVAVLSRIGLRAGKEIASSSVTGEIYGRADVYHQFTDGQDAVFSDPTHQMRETWGTNKTFASIGLGSMLKINDQWGVQLDVEKNLGGKTIDSWLITGQAKYQF